MSSAVLASSFHICWDTIGYSLCSSEDQLGVPPVCKGKWTPLSPTSPLSSQMKSEEGWRGAHRCGYKLSALVYSTTCPLGRSETGARSIPNEALPELQGGESPEKGPLCEGRLGRRCHGSSAAEGPRGCPPNRSLEHTHGRLSEFNG